MRAFMLAVAAGLVLAGGARADEKEELKKFTGTWQAEKITVNGKDMDAEATKAVKLVVAGGKYTLTTARDVIKGTHQLDPSKSPKQIDAVRSTGPDKGKTIKGIYELTGDGFKVCFGAPGKDRPEKFEAKQGSDCRLIVMKRLKK
jgi:uncharacterized protein (TIGR03067 family)